MTHDDPLRTCILQLSRFPGIGERTATRLVYWLMRQTPEVSNQIANAIKHLRSAMTRCSICCNVATVDPCATCSDTKRDSSLICVVERPQDVQAIETSGRFFGRYHVLNGAISPLDGIGPEDLHIRELLGRIQSENTQEVVIATDPDVEGDATALYLARLLQPSGVKVTRLAHGISVGTELEYADRSSIARALDNRRPL